MENIKIDSIDYINSVELSKKMPTGTNLSKGSYHIIKQLKLLKDSDYIYSKKINDTWVKTNGTSKKFDKVLIKKSSLGKNQYISKLILEPNNEPNNKSKNEHIEPKNNIEAMICQPLLNLSENEKFRDSGDNIYEIEVRGNRKYDNVYIKVKDISVSI